MEEIATTSADMPAGPRDAVGHWNVFAKAVADVLGSGPSASRSTVLHALDACHRELNKVQPHHPRTSATRPRRPPGSRRRPSHSA